MCYRYLFWLDNDYIYKNPIIERSNLDGTNRRVLLALQSSHYPQGLAVDEEAKLLYISDSSRHALYVLNFDGNGYKEIFQDSSFTPMDVALFEDRLFWADRLKEGIFSCNISGTNQLIDSWPYIGKPVQVAVAHNSRQPSGVNGCSGNPCSDFCFLASGGSHTCGCETGYAMSADGKTCKTEISEFVLFPERAWGVIMRLSLDVTPYIAEPLPIHYKNLTNPKGLHYDPLTGHMYWTDMSLGVIFRAYPNGTGLERVIDDRISSVHSLAIDPRGRKMYWCDSYAKAIEVADLDGRNRRAIISATSPRQVKLHLGQNYVIWTELGWSKNILKRAHMDGKNVTELYSFDGWYPKMAVDEENDRIFLTTNYDGKIISMNLDGKNVIEIFYENNLEVDGMDVYGNYLYFSDYDKSTVRRLNLTDGSNMTIAQNIRFAGDVYVYDKNRLNTGDNPCSNNNNGCSHLCLPTPSGPTCACPSGMIAEAGSKICRDGGPLLIFLTDYYNEKVYLMNVNGEEGLEVLPFDLSKSRGPSAIDYDPTNLMLYWSDIYNDKINRATLNGSIMETLYDTGIKYPTGLAVDYFSGIMFWTDYSMNIIAVATMNGKHRATLLSTGLHKPSAIAIDIEDNLIFFTEDKDPATISRVYMNGTDQRMIVQLSNLPNGIAVDPTTKTLFWADTKHNEIKYSDYNGKNKDHIFIPSLNNMEPSSIASGSQHVYWLDSYYNALYKVNSTEGIPTVETLLDNLPKSLKMNVYDENKYSGFTGTPCSSNNGGCEQICIPSNNTAKCLCQDGYLLQSDERSCKEEEFNDRFILLTDFYEEEIYVVSMQTGFRKVLDIDLSASRGPASVAFDYCNNFIYWTDVWHEKICRSRMNGSDYEELITTDLLYPIAIRLDCEVGVMYVSDSMNHDIFVASMDGTKRRPLLFMAESPSGLDIDRKKALIFWVESSYVSNRARVWKANLDGTSPSMLIDVTHLGSPNDITADMFLEKVFWTDSDKEAIYSADYSGSNVEILYSDPSGTIKPFGIDYGVGAVYWVDMSGDYIYKTNTTTKETTTLSFGLTYSLGIYVHEVGKYEQFDNVCNTNNGGCSYLCVRVKGGSRCMCPAGELLKDDKKTCEKPGKMNAFLIVADLNELSIISLDPLVDFVKTTLLNGTGMLPFQPTAIDYDPVDEMIYWTDDYYMLIIRSTLDGKTQEILHQCNIKAARGIAVDWIGRKLYWTDAGANRIEVSELDGSNRLILMDGDIYEPNSILVDPVHGWMYWVEAGKHPKIERAHMDGSHREVIAQDDDLTWPHGVAIDVNSQKIYWGDQYTKRIERCNFDGSNREVIVYGLPDYTITQGMAIYGDHVYWADLFDLAVRRANISSGNTTHYQIAARGFLVPHEINIYDPLAKPQMENTKCKNRGCSHLCLITPGSTGKCACPTGMAMMADGKTCNVDQFERQSYEGGFILLTNYYFGGIERIPLSVPKYPCQRLPINQNISKPVAIAFDPSEKHVYWSDDGGSHILRADIDGQNTEVIATTAWWCHGLAVNWLENKIYRTSWLTDTVEVSTFDASFSIVLYSGLYYAGPICLVPEEGVMYIGGSGFITKAYMDGSYNEDLNIQNLRFVVSLALDLETGDLYYSEYYYSIYMYNVKTDTGPTLIVPRKYGSQVYGMAFYDNGLYFIDSLTDTLHLSKIRTGNESVIATGIERAYDMEVYGPKSFPHGESQCTDHNGGCSNICLPAPNSVTCFCESGVQLKDDKKTCAGECPRLYSSKYGKVSNCSHKPGGKCSFSCFPNGFRQEGVKHKECKADGNWTDGDFKCIDIEPPTITCLMNVIKKDNDRGKGFATINMDMYYQAKDNTNTTPNVTMHNAPPRNEFPIGKTSVRLIATDENGLKSNCSITVEVSDVEAPAITCPDKQTFNNTKGTKFRKISQLAEPNITDNSMPKHKVKYRIMQSITLPHTFLIGHYVLTYIATDEAGLTADCTFEVEIKDIEPPKIVGCLPETNDYLSETMEMSVPWSTVQFTDNDGIKDTEIMLNGEKVDNIQNLYVGVHRIKYSATDNSGLTSTCSSTVFVASTICSYLEDNKDVNLNCQALGNGKNCTVSCPEDQGFPLPVSSIFCTTNLELLEGKNKEQIEKNGRLPKCTKTTDEVVVVIDTELTVTVDTCPVNEDEVLSAFTESYTTSVLSTFDECSEGGSGSGCTITNPEIVSCDTGGTKRKRRASDGSMQIQFDQRIPVKKDNNITATSQRLQNKIQSTVTSNPPEVKVDGKSYKVDPTKPIVLSSRSGCPEGYGQGSQGCVLCPSGMYHDISSDECRACAQGWYQSSSGKTSCINCPTKKTVNNLSGADSESGCIPEKEGKKTKTGLIIGLLLAFLLLFIMVVIGALVWRRYRTTGKFFLQPKPTISHPANPLVMSDIMQNVEKGDISISNPTFKQSPDQ